MFCIDLYNTMNGITFQMGGALGEKGSREEGKWKKWRQSFLKTGKAIHFSLGNGEKLVYDIADIKEGKRFS